MKKSLFLSAILSISTVLSAADYTSLTEALHQEVAVHTHPNINKKTHPILFAMIQQLADKALIDVPRYVTLYEGEYTFVDDHGGVHKGMHNLDANANIVGDLYISRKILLVAPYQTIEGIVARAVAEKAVKRSLKGFGVGLAGGTIAGIASGHIITFRNRLDVVPAQILLGMTSALFAGLLYDNHVQKQVDLLAAKLTDPQNVIDGIKAADEVDESYTKHNLISRFIDACNLRGICNTVFYPIRAYTSTERIAYLEQAAK